MAPRYAPLPNPRSLPDSEQELEDAFESDHEDEGHNDHEQTPLTNASHSRPHSSPVDHVAASIESSAIPGAYDFERDYDYPPPGSPPSPSARALPNDIGNSNGLLPTSPVIPAQPRTSFFRRAVGAVLPSYYTRVPTSTSQLVGGGTDNDGVFANVMAKPQRGRVVRTEDGNVHVVPEESQKEVPPSYLEAQADAVPPYWETTVHAPAGMENGGEFIIDDLPTGSFWVFLSNAFISCFFQFVGFLLTYLLATSHAGRFGAKAGLGLTLIQFGFASREVANSDADNSIEGQGDWISMPGPSPTGVPSMGDTGVAPTPDDTPILSITSRDWLSFLFMTLGWFLLLSSIIGYWRVKRWESSVRTPPPPTTPEDIERDIAIRRNIENVFGISFAEDDDERNRQHYVRDEQGNLVTIPSHEALEEARLTRDLRAAGLL
ncbi:hypothetical protein BDQ17DRAFT_1359188 [Cyathus striatus]|nr:hypothetical protein BDQ17DRAFT_1359188 [Cyathus striatus]